MAKITVIGTGLIGTSLALALRQSDLRNLELVGTDYDSTARNGAQKRGAFDKVEGRMQPAVEGADVVVLATPVMAMKDLMETIGPVLSEGAVLTDVGSSKRTVIQWASETLPDRTQFVGGHPMAGRETAWVLPTPRPSCLPGKPYCIVPRRSGPVSRLYRPSPRWPRPSAPSPSFISAEEHDSFRRRR